MKRACFECKSSSELVEHHVVPVVLGGTKTVFLCATCHGKVHDRRNMNASALTRAAMAAKRLRGERVGNVPYGYDLTPNQRSLVQNTFEQRTLRRIQKMNKEGMTLREIARTLTLEQVPTKTGKSEKWCHSAIARILHRAPIKTKKQHGPRS